MATDRIYNTANVLFATSNSINGSWPFDKKLERTISLDSRGMPVLRRELRVAMLVLGAVT